jgi:GDPmannose 4,6-dehydratase
MKALIFGASGQDGHYLDALLRQSGIESVGVSRSGSWLHADVGKRAEVEELVRAQRPDYVFQLAARSTTHHDAGQENHETIATGALNVLECVHRHAPEARVFIAGSGVQFQNQGQPIDEDTPFEATSLYAVARIQSVYAARYYRSLGLRTYVGYLFHHESPLRKPSHMSMRIALAAQRIKREGQGRLQIGDASVVKEWTFAGDVAEAMLRLVRQDAVSEAVVGSGEGHSIEDWLELCFGLAGLSWQDHVDLVPGFPVEYRCLVSRPNRLKSLGWSPAMSFSALAEMMMREA